MRQLDPRSGLMLDGRQVVGLVDDRRGDLPTRYGEFDKFTYIAEEWEPACLVAEQKRYAAWARCEIAQACGLDPLWGPVDWFVLVVASGQYEVVKREKLPQALADGARVVYDASVGRKPTLRERIEQAIAIVGVGAAGGSR